jgi:hypothetical protein
MIHPTYVAVASISAVGTGVIVGIVARAVISAAKKLAKRTKTKRDDHIVQTIDEFLTEHPEALPVVLNLIDSWRK